MLILATQHTSWDLVKTTVVSRFIVRMIFIFPTGPLGGESNESESYAKHLGVVSSKETHLVSTILGTRDTFRSLEIVSKTRVNQPVSRPPPKDLQLTL